MRNLAAVLFLMLSIPFAYSTGSQSDDSKMKILKAYAAAAAAAGSSENCGIAHVEPEKVLDKISQGLRCAYDDGQITSEDADEMIEVIAYSYGKGMEATPSPEMCKVAEFLTKSLLETGGC